MITRSAKAQLRNDNEEDTQEIIGGIGANLIVNEENAPTNPQQAVCVECLVEIDNASTSFREEFGNFDDKSVQIPGPLC